MAVTRADVIYAYRLILGREPENESVIGQLMQAANLSDLREIFLGSEEFFSSYGDHAARTPRVGRFLGASAVDVEVHCTDDQLQAMLDRIAKAWQAMGETEPHWSVITSEKYRQSAISSALEAFYASGRVSVEIILNYLRRANLPVTFSRALDFGCGVGRLTLPLARRAEQVVGVDISPPHIRLAQRRADQDGVSNTSFETIRSVADLDRYRGFDLVISQIVLQHNPPPVMAVLYKGLLEMLAPSGIAIIQLPTYIDGQVFSVADYLSESQPQMEMHALPQSVVYQLIETSKCRVVEVREDGSNGDFPALSHTFVVQRR